MSNYHFHREVTPSEFTELERLVDGVGLDGVLEALAGIAAEKAEHIQSNYAGAAPLDPDGRLWERASRKLYHLQGRLA